MPDETTARASVPTPKYAPAAGYAFGTFKGVFTPSVLTIIGVVLYLRSGWVLGHAGLPGALLIITLATSISFLTGLSVSALATNMRVGGGGAYFIISRSLGVEVGGAVGLPLFFSKTLGISFYIVGFAESVTILFPAVPVKLAAAVTLVGLTVLAYFSADIALRSQFIILALILASLVSFFAGGTPELPAPAAPPEALPASLPFWMVFAVFFPAVTGILSGTAMSGDLKDPARSLPRGTLGALVASYAVYMGVTVFLFAKVPDAAVLKTHPLIMRDVARAGFVVVAALWGATLSSAVSTLLGAPRVLQALAKDRVIPRFLGRGFGKGNNPRIATAAAFLVGLAGVLAGDLNDLAPVMTMFILTTFGLLNLSAAFEGLVASPSWRPKFRVHWSLSLLGAFGCFAAMFMISPGATFAAALVSAAVYYLMKRRSMRADWGDARYGILMLLARYATYKLAQKAPDERTWRPNLLVMSGAPTTRWYLIELANAIAQNRSFLTVATVLPRGLDKGKRMERVEATIADYLRKRRVTALVKVQAADGLFEGLRDIVRGYGFGPLAPNTVLLGETEKAAHYLEFARLVKLIHGSRRNLIVVREDASPPAREEGDALPAGRIDVWWGRERQNSGLMLALGYLVTKSGRWSRSPLVLKTVVEREGERKDAARRLEALTRGARLEADTEVLVRPAGEGVFDVIRASSRGAGLVFLGMREPERGETDEAFSAYYGALLERTAGFPLAALVLAAEEIDFAKIFRAAG